MRPPSIVLASILADHRKRGDRVLVGLDFNFGYPVGTAARLKLEGTPWQAMWKFIAANVVDKADNTNNRYQVAAKMNRLMTDEAWPLWGAPAKQAQRWLTTTKPPAGAGADIPEFRATENAARKGRLQPKSVWQMHGAGAVGGQTLVGIPAVRRLLESLGSSGAVWPFGTGWRELTPDDVEPLSALVVEVWPSTKPTVLGAVPCAITLSGFNLPVVKIGTILSKYLIFLTFIACRTLAGKTFFTIQYSMSAMS